MSAKEVINILVIFLISKSSQENVQWSEWSRLSTCSVTCGNGFRYQYRECNVVNPNINTSFCQGHSEMKIPCVLLACPIVERCNCGCILKEARGRITSKLFYEKAVECYWSIETGFGTIIKITISDLKLAHGYLLLNGNKNFNQKYIMPKERQSNLPVTVTSFGNIVNISLHNYLGILNDEIRFQAEYEEITDLESSNENTAGLNIPAIAGITCCIAIIIVASCIIGYKKYIRSSDINENKINKEEEIDQRSSTSSSNRSSRQKSETPTLIKSHLSNKNALLTSIEQQKLLEYSQRGYPEGGEHYLQQPNYIMQPCWAQVNGKENYVIHSQNGSNYVMIPGHFNAPQKV